MRPGAIWYIKSTGLKLPLEVTHVIFKDIDRHVIDRATTTSTLSSFRKLVYLFLSDNNLCVIYTRSNEWEAVRIHILL